MQAGFEAPECVFRTLPIIVALSLLLSHPLWHS